MQSNHKRIRIAYFTLDLLCIAASFFLVCLLGERLLPGSQSELKVFLMVCSFWGISLIFILNNHQLYLTDRHIGITQEFIKVVSCVLYSAILAAMFIFLTKTGIFSRAIFIEVILFLVILLGGWRILKRIYVRNLLRKGYGNFHVLIAGLNRQAHFLAEEIKNNPYLGLKVVGFVNGEVLGQHEKNGEFIGNIDDLEKIVKKNFVDEIYITDISRKEMVAEIIRKAEKLSKTVRVLVEDFDMPSKKLSIDYIGTLPLMTCFESAPQRADSGVKRSLDILVSGSILILSLPLILLVVLLVKLDTPGPAFYVSRRSGKKGRIFKMYKFRSMVKDAEKQREALGPRSEVAGPIFKIKNDPRLTWSGRLLRKYSVDELPQLFNVLKGDMSLVGPRPFPVEESDKIEYRHIPRLNIKPGITGLAQVKGRSNLKFNQWMRWDNWYLHNWSLGLDIKILFWTIPAVLRSRGAY